MKVTQNNFLEYMASKCKFWTVSLGIFKLFVTMKHTMHSILHFFEYILFISLCFQSNKKKRVVIFCTVLISAGSVLSLLHKDRKYLNTLGYKCIALMRKE